MYANALMQNVTKLMKQLDLGMDGIAVKDVITFTSVNDLPIADVKNLLIQAYESDGCKILEIMGGKLE